MVQCSFFVGSSGVTKKKGKKINIVPYEECYIIYFTWILVKNLKGYFFSSPEPKAHGELIGYPWSGVRPSSVHNAQRSSSPKPLGRSKPNFMWSLLG